MANPPYRNDPAGRLAIVVLCVAFLAGACHTGSAAPNDYRFVSGTAGSVDGSLDFVSPSGTILTTITIEIAETPEARNRGLMERRKMDPGHGMLFIFKSPGPKRFWMRNTYIPLDIVFVDENRRVVSISENTTPFSDKILESVGPARYAVEVNGGFCRKHDIKRGTRVRWYQPGSPSTTPSERNRP